MLTVIKSIFDLDRLNPIIVKELRQGNRSKAFLLNFMLAQVAMLVFVVVALSNASSGNSQDIEAMNIGFWTIVGFFLIVGVPLTGFNAINKERAEARLDLLHLTRLSALRIVSGKWFALVSQAFLITLSVLPYVVARYYYGGVNVVMDLMTIGVLLGFSALVSGLCVSLSSVKSLIVRVGTFGIMLWLSASLLLGYYVRNIYSSLSGGGTSDHLEIVVILLVEALFLLVLAIRFSASTICPLAENHQSRMRIWYLLQLAFLVVLTFFVDYERVFEVAVFAICLGVCVLCYALVQTPVALSSIYRPFVKRGRLGRSAGYLLLYPGFPSALYYTLFCVSFYLLGFFAMEKMHHFLRSDWQLVPYLTILFPTVLGCFFLPLALAMLVRNQQYLLITRYVGVVFILLLLGVLSLTISHNYSIGLSYAFVLSPFSNLFAVMSHEFNDLDVPVYVIGSSISTGWAIFYILRQGSAWRRIEKELERNAEQLLAKADDIAKTGESVRS